MVFPEELRDLEQDLARFEQAVQQFAGRLGLDLTQLRIADHIAARCHQVSTAERWKAGLLQIGTQFSEARINGRPICLFKLHQPLQLLGWQIDVVEIPWPGEKKYEHESWEHIEIVLRGDPETLEARARALLPQDMQTSLPDVLTLMNSPQGENQGLANPTLAVSDGRTTIKFHPWTLEEVVASEEAPQVGN